VSVGFTSMVMLVHTLVHLKLFIQQSSKPFIKINGKGMLQFLCHLTERVRNTGADDLTHWIVVLSVICSRYPAYPIDNFT
jgi:hypothetical protein